MTPAIAYIPDVVANHRDVLHELIHRVAWDKRMQARHTASFGRPYNYSDMTYPEQPFLPTLVDICQTVAPHIGFRPNNCLINYYIDGRSRMGFHADSLDGLTPQTGVAIVSLGACRTLWFRSFAQPEQTFAQPLEGGSLLYMPPAVQRQWKHGVRREPEAGPRISLTFRSVCPGA